VGLTPIPQRLDGADILRVATTRASFNLRCCLKPFSTALALTEFAECGLEIGGGGSQSKNPFFLSFFQNKINLDKVWQPADFLIVSNQHVNNTRAVWQ
jgi:hypothetical protein